MLHQQLIGKYFACPHFLVFGQTNCEWLTVSYNKIYGDDLLTFTKKLEHWTIRPCIIIVMALKYSWNPNIDDRYKRLTHKIYCSLRVIIISWTKKRTDKQSSSSANEFYTRDNCLHVCMLFKAVNELSMNIAYTYTFFNISRIANDGVYNTNTWICKQFKKF